MAEAHPIPTDPRFQDLSGRTFGKLTVLFYAGRRAKKYSLWHCRCECGNEITLVSSRLTLGQTKACVPCGRASPNTKIRKDLENLVGRVVGRLTVVSFDHQSNKHPKKTYWLCKCTCGESVVVRTDILKDGRTQSCGCMNILPSWRDKEKPAERTCMRCQKSFPLNLKSFYRHPFSKFGYMTKCRTCHKIERSINHKKQGGKLRMQVLTHYSGTPPRCQCPGCHETHIEFLTIDHVHGDGAQHRKEIKGGSNTYRWLRRHNYPDGFQVLCINCNFALGKYGYCPHCPETKREVKHRPFDTDVSDL